MRVHPLPPLGDGPHMAAILGAARGRRFSIPDGSGRLLRHGLAASPRAALQAPWSSPALVVGMEAVRQRLPRDFDALMA
jgi:hypothetical protein